MIPAITTALSPLPSRKLPMGARRNRILNALHQGPHRKELRLEKALSKDEAWLFAQKFKKFETEFGFDLEENLERVSFREDAYRQQWSHSEPSAQDPSFRYTFFKESLPTEPMLEVSVGSSKVNGVPFRRHHWEPDGYLLQLKTTLPDTMIRPFLEIIVPPAKK